MKSILPASILLLLLVVTACSTSTVVTKDITASQLKEAIANDSLLVVVDVRKPSELSGEWGYIEASINIPVDDLEDRLGELIKYKQDYIAVVCRSGNRSKRATAILVENGFNAVNVLGGMKAYSKIE